MKHSKYVLTGLLVLAVAVAVLLLQVSLVKFVVPILFLMLGLEMNTENLVSLGLVILATPVFLMFAYQIGEAILGGREGP